MPNPYLVKGFKINIRHYLLAVCEGGRLRGYLHENGKNIYSKEKYREPWSGDQSWDRAALSGQLDAHRIAAIKKRMDELITTGYVPANHYDDMPLTAQEFYRFVNSTDTRTGRFLFKSMQHRLALALHAAKTDGPYDLCDVAGERLETESVPTCLHASGDSEFSAILNFILCNLNSLQHQLTFISSFSNNF